jgi:hypothetical protein
MDPDALIRWYLNIRLGILLTDLSYGMSKDINAWLVREHISTAKRNLFWHIFSHFDSYRAKFLSKNWFRSDSKNKLRNVQFIVFFLREQKCFAMKASGTQIIIWVPVIHKEAWSASASKNLSVFNRKSCLNSRKYDPGCSILISCPSLIPDPGVKRHRSRIRIRTLSLIDKISCAKEGNVFCVMPGLQPLDGGVEDCLLLLNLHNFLLMLNHFSIFYWIDCRTISCVINKFIHNIT